MKKFAKNPEEQLKNELRRFRNRNRPKLVLAEKLASKEAKQLNKIHSFEEKEKNFKMFLGDVY